MAEELFDGGLFAQETVAGIRLSELTTRVGNAIRMAPDLRYVWVEAELSDVRRSGGHCYMELIEKDDSGATRAKIRANIWASSFPRLNAKFLSVTGKEIITGLKVLVRGSVTYHNLYGISFNIDDIYPEYTMGDLERLRREILERLRKEGVIDNNKRLVMPEAPQRIAVISAANAAGYGDFINQITGNSAGVVVYPMLFGATLQGERTSVSVRAALDRIERHADFWDCVVIIRGGGASTDLNGFDDYELARRVATCPIPVIVGIGHERDRNVLDEIANVRCKTPTAVAAYLVDRLSAASARVDNLVATIMRYTTDRLTGESRRLDYAESRLPQAVKLVIMNAGMRLERLATGISMRTSGRISREMSRLDSLQSNIPMAVARTVERESRRLDHLHNMLRVLSPENILRRGYSVTRVNGRAVASAADLRSGDLIETTLYKGNVTSRVDSVDGADEPQ